MSMLRISLILLAGLLAGAAQADTTAKIAKIALQEQEGLVYIYPEGGVQNVPVCANKDYLSFKMSRPMAKEYLSVLMAAFAADKSVAFRTERNCVDQPTADTIMYFSVTR